MAALKRIIMLCRERFAFNIRKFFSTVLKSKEHLLAEPFKRFVRSYSSDLVHGITWRKVITLKHFLISIGLHYLTGLKAPIEILSHLGHSINYNLVCEVETAEAELALKLLEEDQGVRSLLPISDNATVLTCWWADNFNQTPETHTSHDEINSTHTVEFLGKSQSTRDSDATISVPRTGRRSLQMTNQQLSNIKLDKKREPNLSNFDTCDLILFDTEEEEDFKWKYFLWTVVRLLSSNYQAVPTFSGWSISQADGESLTKTILTYLPSLSTRITEGNTIYKIFKIIQKRAIKMNIPYANITFDIGAAMNAFKVLWNYPKKCLKTL